MGDFGRFLAGLGAVLALAACGATAHSASATYPVRAMQTTSQTPPAAPATPEAVAASASSPVQAAAPAPTGTPSPTPASTASQQLPHYGNPIGHAYVPPAGHAVNTAKPNHVIGNGSPTECTSANVVKAVAEGGIITFNCGTKPITITMTATAKVVHGRRIVIDGGGKVTLSGGGRIRILYMDTCNNCWEDTGPQLIVQNMRFVDAYSGAHQIGSSNNYGGGAIYAYGGQLKVINSAFIDNRCYQYGPDLGGGAIRAYGMDMKTPIYITNDTFRGNTCSNGGALSGLYANFVVINSLFTGNKAIGLGANPASSGTPGGGSGGAIYTDGANYNLTIDGTVIRYGSAREGGGAIFYVVDKQDNGTPSNIHTFKIEYSTLHHNPSEAFQTAPGIYDSINQVDTQPIVIHSTIN